MIRNEIIKNRILIKGFLTWQKNLLNLNSSIIDAGANYGQMSVLFSNICSNCIVYSFEASNYIFNILIKNINANSKKYNWN